MFYRKSCSWKFCNIHRKTTVLESLFHKVTDPLACNFIKKRLRKRRFPVNIAQILRTPNLKIICERLLLNNIIYYPRIKIKIWQLWSYDFLWKKLCYFIIFLKMKLWIYTTWKPWILFNFIFICNLFTQIQNTFTMPT